MLFGTEQLQKKVIEEIRLCEREQNIKVIYGAVVGSISKGIQYSDSDYDTRFLYIKDDFPEQILYPVALQEERVIYRKYMENTCFEKIPFWELSSFLQYMIEPCINQKFSTGLYITVGWTFLSPYTWDPYGLQNKIVPLIQKLFFKDYFIQYHKEILDKYPLLGETVNAKEYLYILHAALSIEYANKYNEYPPIYMQALLQLLSDKLKNMIFEIIKKVQKEAKEYVYTSNLISSCHDTSKNIMIDRKSEIDNYLEKIYNKYENFKLSYLQQEEKMMLQERMKGIYEIVKRSIFDEEPINERW